MTVGVIGVSLRSLSYYRLAVSVKNNVKDNQIMRIFLGKSLYKEFIKTIEYTSNIDSQVFEAFTWVLNNSSKRQLLKHGFYLEEFRPSFYQLLILRILYFSVYRTNKGFEEIKNSKWCKIIWSHQNAKSLITLHHKLIDKLLTK